MSVTEAAIPRRDRLTILLLAACGPCAWADHPYRSTADDYPDAAVYTRSDHRPTIYGAYVFAQGDIDGNGLPDLVTNGRYVANPARAAVNVYFDATLQSLDGRNLEQPDFRKGVST
jgi:hypothetical protein